MIDTGDLSDFEVLYIVVQTFIFLLTAIFTGWLVWLAKDVKKEIKLSEALRQLHRLRDLAIAFYRAGIEGRREEKLLVEVELTYLALRMDKPTQLKADINHLSLQLDTPSVSSQTDSLAYQSLQKVLKRIDELIQEKL